MTPDAPRLVLDVSCVMRINHESCFLVAGAIFGEVEMSFCMAGTTFREIFGDSRSAKCHDGLHGRIMAGWWSDYRRIVLILGEASQGFSSEILNLKSRGRRSIW